MPFASKVIIAVAVFEGGFLLWYFLMSISMWRGSKGNGRDKVAAWLSMVDLSRFLTVGWFTLFLFYAFDLQTAQVIPERLLWFLGIRVMLSLFKALAVSKLAWHLRGREVWERAFAKLKEMWHYLFGGSHG